MVQVNTTPEGSSQPQKAAAKAAAGTLTPAAGQDNSVMDVLENTLWNRQLGVMSEEIVAALVCQIFEGGPLDRTLHCNFTCVIHGMHQARREFVMIAHCFGKADQMVAAQPSVALVVIRASVTAHFHAVKARLALMNRAIL